MSLQRARYSPKTLSIMLIKELSMILKALSLQKLRVDVTRNLSIHRQTVKNLRKLAQECIEAEAMSRTVINKDPLNCFLWLHSPSKMPCVLPSRD